MKELKTYFFALNFDKRLIKGQLESYNWAKPCTNVPVWRLHGKLTFNKNMNVQIKTTYFKVCFLSVSYAISVQPSKDKFRTTSN